VDGRLPVGNGRFAILRRWNFGASNIFPFRRLSNFRDAMIKFLAATAFVALGSTAATAASFDCDKAAKPDETAVCENRSLNDADVRMATMFDLASRMVAMGERDGLKTVQSKWLEARAKCEGDVACLTGIYDQRIADLEKIFADFESRVAQ
jgi:uncharacterized protein